MSEGKKAVRCSVNLKQPLHAITVNKEQNTIAIACKHDVQLLNLGPMGLGVSSSIAMSQSSKSVDSFVLTDVSWCHAVRDRLAASATNGDIAVISINSPSTNQVWSAGESSRAVNRVSWHASEPHTMASAHQDGLVKLWDCRQKEAAALVKSYQPRADAGRDVQFDPFHENILAATFESGNLVLWDRRMADQSWLKISAHINSVQTLAWNPHKEWHLATGGRDMSIKVWDIRRASPSTSTNFDHIQSGLPTAPSHLPLSLKPSWQLTTPSVVGRIAWRGLPSHPDQIASVSVTERADVSVWKLGFNNIPACIVRGNVDNITVGFSWLDTPSVDKIPVQKPKPGQRKAGKSRSSTSSQESANSSGRGVNQHIITISKDGLVEIQDVRNGDFPRQRISRNVTAISPRGHVAFQRSNVIKYDLLGLEPSPAGAVDQSDGEKRWHDADPSCFGMSFEKASENVYAAKDAQPGQDAEQGGVIESGLSRISDLAIAHRITTGSVGGAAEGGAFDPAIITLLASSYTLGHCSSKGTATRAESIVQAVDALECNNRIALDAGLDGHASILSSVATLITLLNRSRVQNRHSVPLGENAFITSNVSVEDPFRNLALFSLRDLLSELLDAGDCQHFVICFEILRRNGLLVGISESYEPDTASNLKSDNTSGGVVSSTNGPVSSRLLASVRVREAYLAYIDILSRLGLFTAANDLIKASEDPYISELSKKGIRLKVGCAKCGKEVSADQVSGGNGVTAITSIFCGKCQRSAGRCVLCQKPVLGLFRWCPICSHGGHTECIKKWISRERTNAKNVQILSRGSRILKKKSICQDIDKNPSFRRSSTVTSTSQHISCPSGCGHHCFFGGTENSVNK